MRTGWTALQTNFLSAVRLDKALVPQMVERGSGVVVHITSTVAVEPAVATPHYSAAKAALSAYSKALSNAVAGNNVRVTGCRRPGSRPHRSRPWSGASCKRRAWTSRPPARSWWSRWARPHWAGRETGGGRRPGGLPGLRPRRLHHRQRVRDRRRLAAKGLN